MLILMFRTPVLQLDKLQNEQGHFEYGNMPWGMSQSEIEAMFKTFPGTTTVSSGGRVHHQYDYVEYKYRNRSFRMMVVMCRSNDVLIGVSFSHQYNQQNRALPFFDSIMNTLIGFYGEPEAVSAIDQNNYAKTLRWPYVYSEDNTFKTELYLTIYSDEQRDWGLPNNQSPGSGRIVIALKRVEL
jgi:hypothetical protein